MEISIDGGRTWVQSDEVRVRYNDLVFVEDDGSERNAYLNLTYTNEGEIADVIDMDSGEVLSTDSATAQELIDPI